MTHSVKTLLISLGILPWEAFILPQYKQIKAVVYPLANFRNRDTF